MNIYYQAGKERGIRTSGYYLVKNSKSCLKWVQLFIWYRSRKHFPQDKAKAVDIDFSTVRFVLHHLWSHPSECPSVICQRVTVLFFTSYSKINNLRTKFLIEYDVLWLHVTMDDSLWVNVWHAACDIQANWDDLAQRKSFVIQLVQKRSQRTTRKEFSDDTEYWWTAACSNQLQRKNVNEVRRRLIKASHDL